MRAPEIDVTFAPRRGDATSTTEIEGEAVVLDLERDRLHTLNGTAALLWRCFDGIGTIDDIAGDMAEVFGVPTVIVRAEVLAAVRSLGEQGLLAGVESSFEAGGRFVSQEFDVPDSRFVFEPPNA